MDNFKRISRSSQNHNKSQIIDTRVLSKTFVSACQSNVNRLKILQRSLNLKKSFNSNSKATFSSYLNYYLLKNSHHMMIKFISHFHKFFFLYSCLKQKHLYFLKIAVKRFQCPIEREISIQTLLTKCQAHDANNSSKLTE